LCTILFAGVLIPVLMKYVLGANEAIPGFVEIFKRILSGSIDQFSNCFHLWYIIELMKCYLMLPLLQMVCTKEAHGTKVRRLLLIIGFYAGVLIITKDLLFVQSLGLFSYMPITISMWYLLLGYEMRVFIESHGKSLKGVIGGLMLFVIGTVGVFYYTYVKDYQINGLITQTYYHYGFIFVVASVIGLFYAVSQIPFKDTHKWITTIGGTTFGVYLLHPVVYSVIWHLGIEKLIPVIGLKLFLLLFVLLTFVGSVVGILILKWILKFIVDRKNRLKHQNQPHQ
ncbi:MAG: acyltransferase family protein, partial [Clostridia bacterium]|nr:acyltransferase family protein [Clostridia bacterium]